MNLIMKTGSAEPELGRKTHLGLVGSQLLSAPPARPLQRERPKVNCAAHQVRPRAETQRTHGHASSALARQREPLASSAPARHLNNNRRPQLRCPNERCGSSAILLPTNTTRLLRAAAESQLISRRCCLVIYSLSHLFAHGSHRASANAPTARALVTRLIYQNHYRPSGAVARASSITPKTKRVTSPGAKCAPGHRRSGAGRHQNEPPGANFVQIVAHPPAPSRRPDSTLRLARP